MRTVLRYIDILENAFIIDPVNGGFGGNSVANFDMGVRTRIHELSLANAAATFGDLLLMSLDAMQASKPTRALLVEGDNIHKAIQKGRTTMTPMVAGRPLSVLKIALAGVIPVGQKPLLK